MISRLEGQARWLPTEERSASSIARSMWRSGAELWRGHQHPSGTSQASLACGVCVLLPARRAPQQTWIPYWLIRRCAPIQEKFSAPIQQAVLYGPTPQWCHCLSSVWRVGPTHARHDFNLESEASAKQECKLAMSFSRRSLMQTIQDPISRKLFGATVHLHAGVYVGDLQSDWSASFEG